MELRMKVLLRDEEMRLYCGTDDRWVADPQAAMDFRALEKAGEKAAERPAQTLSVVLKYESPDYELALNPVFCSPRTRNRGASLGV